MNRGFSLIQEFCEVEIRLIFCKEIVFGFPWTSSLTDFLSSTYRLGRRDHEAGFSLLK